MTLDPGECRAAVTSSTGQCPQVQLPHHTGICWSEVTRLDEGAGLGAGQTRALFSHRFPGKVLDWRGQLSAHPGWQEGPSGFSEAFGWRGVVIF